MSARAPGNEKWPHYGMAAEGRRRWCKDCSLQHQGAVSLDRRKPQTDIAQQMRALKRAEELNRQAGPAYALAHAAAQAPRAPYPSHSLSV